MAITKIHAIKSTPQKSVDYIAEPHKTDNRILVDTYACGIETAGHEFVMENSMSLINRKEQNVAYHLIQSFVPGEVSFEEAHKIGQEFADQFLKNGHSYVLATHIDREHVHNHLIFGATNYQTHERYHECNATYREIRSLSDRLCKEHHLSVIKPGVEKGKKYNEWQADKKNESFRFILKSDIFDCIRSARSYDDFLEKMIARGYEIKGSELGECAPKYISFKPPGYGNFIRGSHRTLGKGNTKEEILERIEKQIASRAEWIEKQKNLPYSERNIIDASGNSFKDKPFLEDWIIRENLKVAASTYASVGSTPDLDDMIAKVQKKIKENREKIVDIDKEKKAISEQIRYLEMFKRMQPFYEEYTHSKNKEKYFMEHETNINLYEGSKSFLENYGINPDKISVEDLKTTLTNLEQKRSALKNDNSFATKELDDLQRKKQTLDKYFKRDKVQPEKEKQKSQNKHR